jgi:hypothetical protein
MATSRPPWCKELNGVREKPLLYMHNSKMSSYDKHVRPVLYPRVFGSNSASVIAVWHRLMVLLRYEKGL